MIIESELTLWPEGPKALLKYPHLEFIDLSDNHIDEIPSEIIVMKTKIAACAF